MHVLTSAPVDVILVRNSHLGTLLHQMKYKYLPKRSEALELQLWQLSCILLFKEVSVDLKLLFEHDLAPVLDNECVWLQVLGGPQNLPVFLHACHPPQL